MQSKTGFFAMAFTAAGLLLMPVANAQDKSPAAPSPSPTARGATTVPAVIPDTKLDAAAAAVKRVSVIRETYDQKVAQAPVADKQRLTSEADDAMVKAVTDQGLSIEEYSAIIKVAQNNPDVRNKLLQRMK